MACFSFEISSPPVEVIRLVFYPFEAVVKCQRIQQTALRLARQRSCEIRLNQFFGRPVLDPFLDRLWILNAFEVGDLLFNRATPCRCFVAPKLLQCVEFEHTEALSKMALRQPAAIKLSAKANRNRDYGSGDGYCFKHEANHGQTWRRQLDRQLQDG